MTGPMLYLTFDFPGKGDVKMVKLGLWIRVGFCKSVITCTCLRNRKEVFLSQSLQKLSINNDNEALVSINSFTVWTDDIQDGRQHPIQHYAYSMNENIIKK